MSNNQHNNILTEGLRYGDLRELVSDLFTVDQYRSKMGEDADIVVIGFRVKEKHPATDLMEFIEKGYPFILDADMSAGEEHDGQYQVFVEMERTPELPYQMKDLLSGVSHLCGFRDWRFRYQKNTNSVDFNEDAVLEHIPTTPAEYAAKITEIKSSDVKSFFDQGAVDVELSENNTITFSKPYAGPIQAKFVAIGDYDYVKNTVPGRLSLDESSQSQVLFLNKYIGNYDINKIGNKFLIRNGKQAVVIEKDRW
jgi:SepF-like predicted cell division protein (DUF552 family)